MLKDDLLKNKLKQIPNLAGVYIMKDANNTIIYIGKAKSLKKRVKSYFSGQDDRYQVSFLMQKVFDIEVIVTETEEQALIIERDLINKNKPKYNIRLKDDKNYLNIKLDENNEWPRLELVRKTEGNDSFYFGPFTSGYEVRELMELINKTIPLRTCSDSVFYNRQRPCLEYQMKRCLGPCCLEVDVNDYLALVKQAKSVLNGNVEGILKELNKKMDNASRELMFEDAANFRDKIEILKNYKEKKKYVSSNADNQDIFAIYRDYSLASLEVVNVRNGRITSSKNYTFENLEVPTSEVLQSAIEQYYNNEREIPDELLLNIELDEDGFVQEFLSKKRAKKVEIIIPKIGVKARMLGLAMLNAKHSFETKFLKDNYAKVAKDLAVFCKLKQIPRKIECVDISNIQGSDIVGAITAYFDGVRDKDNYKKYKISNQGKPDDFYSIYEVILRRVKKGIELDNLPDLIVIDGGKAQLDKAKQAIDELNVEIDLIAIAKTRTEKGGKGQSGKSERVFIVGEKEGIHLKTDKEVTRFLSNIRDETHRFVITYHRQIRSKRTVASVLDGFKGIGIIKKSLLLKRYKSIENLRNINPKEVAKQAKISLEMANKLQRFLQEKID